MVFFRAKFRDFVRGLSFSDQEIFLVDVLRLYRLDPSVYLPLWVAVVGFIIFFGFVGLRVVSFWMLIFLVFHFLIISVSYIVFYRRFVSRWFKD